MNCPRCGTVNPEACGLCELCSWVLREEDTSTIAENPEAGKSGLAVASLVLGILGLFTFGLTFLPAVICGVIAVFVIDRSAGRQRGKGIAIFGYSAPFLLMPVFFLMAIIAAMFMPALGQVKETAMIMVCGENMREVYGGFKVYSGANDGMLPEAQNWCDELMSVDGVDYKLFCCPSMCDEGSSYAVNVNAAGRRLDSLNPDMVLLFESYPGWNTYGGAELVSTEYHGDNGCNILFCDGRVEFVSWDKIEDLLWQDGQIMEADDAQY